ncbi:hypothetical protein NEF87_001825 [Candidatus Lokiarchaeum ossiferum]|uniref:Uncharacterized protein n=1 Tax=Candidatus Lokiarchaeum ossiferum TaxID=2951803 RepID=A0ABY6HPT8_9ARCH|nr:hypothetical protein NEF87_001825 [Candidatus Lokiarchaeum sp. B-35]
MVLQSKQNSFYESQNSTKDSSQLLTELRFLLEHSVEARKVTLREYFSLLLKFNQQGSAKKLKDHFHEDNFKESCKTSHNQALLEIIMRVFSEYESMYLDTSEEILWHIIEYLIVKLSDYQYCTECFNWQISEIPRMSKKNEKEKQKKWFCSSCQNRVTIFPKFELFPDFLEYFIRLNSDVSRFKRIKKKLFKKWSKGLSFNSKKHQHLIILFYELFEDLYSYAKKQSDIKGIYKIWSIGQKFNFISLFKEDPAYVFVADHLVKQIERADFSDYSMCLDYVGKMAPPGKYSIQDFLLKGGIEKNIVRAVSTCELDKFQHSFNFGVNNGLIQHEEFLSSPHFNAACSRGLFFALKNSHFDKFEDLVDLIHFYGINTPASGISNRYRLMGEIFINSIRMQRLDRTFSILKFGLKHKLYNHPSSKERLQQIKSLKRNKQLIQCLKNLMDIKNGVNLNEMLNFIYYYLPPKIFEYFTDLFEFITDEDELINYMNDFVDNFTLYGLSLKKIGTTSHFMKNIKKILSTKILYQDEVEILYSKRTILLSRSNLYELRRRIHSKQRNYEFLMLGMVMKGGLGPQGFGFVYLTPRGEMVEICSDSKANDAYIVHFKQFLKTDFINELEAKIRTLSLTIYQRERLLEILEGKLGYSQLIGYKKEQFILHQVKDFLEDEFDFKRITSDEISKLFHSLENKIHAILSPVSLVDQYRCRLDLVTQGKVSPGDIAKLTSLGEKSHFDLLQERYFYQSILQVYKKKFQNDDSFSDPNVYGDIDLI